MRSVNDKFGNMWQLAIVADFKSQFLRLWTEQSHKIMKCTATSRDGYWTSDSYPLMERLPTSSPSSWPYPSAIFRFHISKPSFWWPMQCLFPWSSFFHHPHGHTTPTFYFIGFLSLTTEHQCIVTEYSIARQRFVRTRFRDKKLEQSIVEQRSVNTA
jgi:hypothetical protein